MKKLNAFVIFALSLLLLNSNVFAMKRVRKLLPSQQTFAPSGQTPSRFSRERLSSTFAPLKKYVPKVPKRLKSVPTPFKRFSPTRHQKSPQQNQLQQETTASQKQTVGFYPIQQATTRQDVISGKAQLPEGMKLYKRTPKGKQTPLGHQDEPYKIPATPQEIPRGFYQPPVKPMLQPQKLQAPAVPTTPKPTLKRQDKVRKHTVPSYNLPAVPPTQQQQPIVIKPTQAPVTINLLGN